ncbi:MAG: hypothetical protein CM15mP83_8000 [Flavobacteriaceae bacterium]|nr:MAG: hypothetical protein CM15mP83_8000 [Flavobacteriaceae bacterium]
MGLAIWNSLDDSGFQAPPLILNKKKPGMRTVKVRGKKRLWSALLFKLDLVGYYKYFSQQRWNK